MLSPVAPDQAPDILTPEKIPAPVNVPHRARWGGWLVLGVLWALAAGFIVLTATNYRRVALAADRLEALYRASPANVAGRGLCAPFAAEQPPTMFDPDSHCWINLTQRQIAQGTVRPHDFPFDNAPYGRQRHWSSSFSWWLLIVGAVARLWTGLPLAQSVAQTAASANPVLFVLFLATLGLVLRRRLAAGPNGIFLVTLAASYGVEWDFSYGRPDHHGLHLMAYLGLVLGALAAGLGWVRGDGDDTAPDADGGAWHLVRPRTRREARRWFTASAVCGGIGLWIGSAQQCVCIGVLGAGAVLGALLFARPAGSADPCRFDPALWRYWARVGAATGFGFYLVEYFPSHMETHLEANHPFVALGWLGAGELMYVLLTARVDWPGARARAGEMALRTGLGLLGVAALPLALKFGPAAWFVLGDPMLLRSTKVISEGMAWINPPTVRRAAHEFWNYTGVLMLALPLAVSVLLLRRRRMPPWQAAALTALLLAATVFLGWTLLQNRWMGFLETSLAMLAMLVAPCVPMPVGFARRVAALPVALLALTVPGWAGFGWLQLDTLADNPLLHAKAMMGDMMGTKEAAWNLRYYAEKFGTQTPCRVMATPGPSPVLHYYGGVDTVGSYYWENVPALHAAVDFFTDPGEDTARRIVRERGVDFVLVTSRPSFVLEMQWLRLGHSDVADARRSLAFRLTNPVAAQPPAWLEEVPLVDAPLAREQGVRIYRVVRERL